MAGKEGLPIMSVEIFQGKGLIRNWYWRLKAANGEIVAQSEGYFSRYNAERAVKKIFGTQYPIRIKRVQ